MELTDFKMVARKYETIFFDAFGVLKNHKGLIPGIGNTFQYLNQHGIDFYVLTNDASRSPAELAASYEDLGIYDITEEKIISSGMLAREYLKLKVKSGTVAYLGTRQSAHYIETLGLKTVSIANVDLENASDIQALVFLDDEGFDWREDLNRCINLLRQQNIPAIVCNTDYSYPESRKEVAIAIGALAHMVEDIVGKKFIKFGKPDAQIFIFAYEHAAKRGGTTDKDKILMVGDTLVMDILGGNKFGLDTALVLTGNTLTKNTEMRINSLGIIPTFVCESAVIDQ
ncbi:HAD-IIA family hydrolase [Fulvivirga sp. M361]|uniref:HAD-IIA family hydrolase n=1 Tax=Fulvivirga sp. M361 TaxID=2594266 RepID=UPI00117B5577|nr:HAD-IIA family hydrolase [Fulvivirga sp. M361]TRX60800.1 HAD-IIA family hydrolase [Fulvivirga sp. M361]